MTRRSNLDSDDTNEETEQEEQDYNQDTIQNRKLNFETIDEQKAELEEFRYKLDSFEARLQSSTFMDSEERYWLEKQAKEARAQLRLLEKKVSRIHRKSQRSLIIIFVIFTLFITLYIFLMIKTIWKEERNYEELRY